jgi:hypothetical protein
MAQLVFHLLSLREGVDATPFVQALRALPENERPLWVGHCQHWMHEPHISQESLTSNGPTIKSWDYAAVSKPLGPDSLDLPASIDEFVSTKWSMVTNTAQDVIDALGPKLKTLPSQSGPQLPAGWSATDHQGLDESKPPADLVMSLGASSRPLHASESTPTSIGLKDFVRSFGTSHPGQVVMFNLLSFVPGREQEYMKYVAAFGEIAYGGEALLWGFDVKNWTSKAQDSPSGAWNGAAIVWYPSVWNFAKMLDDPRYAEMDRKYKQGVIVDNPLICCTPVDL